jgi:hypothetical protein
MKRENAARLLAPAGRLSSLEKDAIFDGIAAGNRSWIARHWGALSAATVAVAAAAVLFVVWPSGTSAPSTLTARGSASLPLVLRCGAREPGTCLRGDRLTFDFGTSLPEGYVAVFARGESGTVFWYVPAEEETASVALTEHTSAGVLDTVAVIDDAYTPGRYDVFAIVSQRPLSRTEIRAFAQGDRLVAPPDIHIESRSFVIRSEESL